MLFLIRWRSDPRWQGPIVVPPGPATVYQWSCRITVRTLGWISVVLGGALIVGGPQKFSSPGFAVARLVPGGAYTWGTLILLSGVAVILASRQWHRRAIGMALAWAATWNSTFAIMLAFAALNDPRAATTGICAYGGYAVLCLIQRVTARGLST